MSVTQVIGSSRINNTIYLTVGSIYWTVILDLVNVSLDLTVETALLVIPVATVFGTLLWALQFEKVVIESILLRYLKGNREGREARNLMARSILFIMPWQASYEIQPTISEMFKTETKRIVNSIILKDDIEDLYQVFWVVFVSFPLVYLLGNILPLFRDPIAILLVGVIFSLSVATPVLWRKKNLTTHVIRFAFFRWLQELISGDKKRRESSTLFRKPNENCYHLDGFDVLGVRESLETVAAKAVELALVKDWMGFTLNTSNAKPFVHNMLLIDVSSILLNEFIIDWTWYYSRGLNHHGTLWVVLLNIFNQIRDARREIRDAGIKYIPMEIKYKWRGSKYEASFHSRGGTLGSDRLWAVSNQPPIQQLFSLIENIFPKTEKTQIIPEFDMIFWKLELETIELLRGETLWALAAMPYNRESKQWTFPNEVTAEITEAKRETWHILLLRALLDQAEEGNIDEIHVHYFAKRWEIPISQYIRLCGPLTLRKLLEVEIQQSEEEIVKWGKYCIRECKEKLDFERAARFVSEKLSPSNYQDFLNSFGHSLTYVSHFERKILEASNTFLSVISTGDAKVKLGMVLESLEDYPNAAEAYVQASELNSENIPYFILFGERTNDYRICLSLWKSLEFCNTEEERIQIVDLIENLCQCEVDEVDDDDYYY